MINQFRILIFRFIPFFFFFNLFIECSSKHNDDPPQGYLYEGQMTMVKSIDSSLYANINSKNGHSLFTIGHCSDVHAGCLNWNFNLKEFIWYFNRDNIKCLTSILINTGDLSNGYSLRNKNSTLKEIRSVVTPFINQDIPSITLIGNHDSNIEEAGYLNTPGVYNQAIDKQQQYNEIIKPSLEKWFHDSDQGKTYYNVDFSKYKIRLVCLDFIDYPILPDESNGNKLKYEGRFIFSQAQLDWLYKTLYSTPKNWGVIIAIHGLPKEAIKIGTYNQGTQLLPEVINAFKHGKRFQHQWNGGNYPELSTKVDFDFRQKGESEFICWIAGHIHGRYYTTADNYPDQVMLTTPCIYTMDIKEFFQHNRPYALDRKSNTITQNSFNILQIDREQKKIYVTAYGAYIDYYGNITNRTTVINY